MRKKVSIISGAKTLTREEQKNVTGGLFSIGIKKCGCDCRGNVTGPLSCLRSIACPQVYTCDDSQYI